MTRVIGHYPDSKTPHLIIDCGFTALSLHGGGNCCGMTPGSGYGAIIGHPELKLSGMSQEHGVVVPSSGGSLDFSRYPLDTVFRIYPDHSCATCAMHPVFYVTEDDGQRVIDEWIPARGW